jgi:hypothetical protein
VHESSKQLEKFAAATPSRSTIDRWVVPAVLMKAASADRDGRPKRAGVCNLATGIDGANEFLKPQAGSSAE